MAGTLYVVATPIGNLGDLSPRAAEVLASVDLIAAEDTRTSGVLLDKLGISRQRLAAYHKFNEEESAAGLAALLREGKDLALITDAGTPCISDPGCVLVRAAAEAGVCVTAVPGASAVAAALSVSGFNTLSFSFYGFLPRRDGEIAGVFRRIRSEYARVAVFYESPRRIAASMKILCRELPGAGVCLCNDLTKKFERIYRGSPERVLAELSDNPAAEKGEYVLVLSLPPAEERAEGPAPLPAEAALCLRLLEGETVREAVEALAATGAYGKNELKRAGIRVKNRFGAV